MRATLVGHACWLFETTAGCFLTDPVLFDPFEEGTVTSCPRRTVRVEQIPALQGIIVSHRHLDHFDLIQSKLLQGLAQPGRCSRQDGERSVVHGDHM